MSIAQDSSGLDATPWGAPRSPRYYDPPKTPFFYFTYLLVLAALAFYSWKMIRIGLDMRSGFWTYWAQHRMAGDASNGLEWGDRVLRLSEGITRQIDSANASPNPSRPTIAQPGPGLFDPPLTRQIFLQRWQHLCPIYAQILRGWNQVYDHFDGVDQDENLGLDYPPLRLLTITLWTWRAQSTYPGLNFYPVNPQPWHNNQTGTTTFVTEDAVMPPMLLMNTILEGMGAIAAFVLVWTWERRQLLRPVKIPSRYSNTWRARWGSAFLLLPPALLGIFLLIRPWIEFVGQTHTDNLLDGLMTSPAFWISIVLHFTAVVSLARFLPPPFRGLACGIVAATLVWMNPPMLVIGHGWPQWDVWMPPFFLVACAFVSLDWWLCAGITLGIGCMFKGQILFVAPVLILCPLLAGWPSRFLRIFAGLAASIGLVVSPWLLSTHSAQSYVTGIFLAAAAVCILALNRRDIYLRFRRGGAARAFALTAIILAMLPAAGLALWIITQVPAAPRIAAILLCIGVVTLPWFLPRNYTVGWLATVLAASLFIAGFGLKGRFSWWNVGFAYGTRKHQVMQMGRDSLSNLSSILEKRFGYGLHDTLMTLHLPFAGDFDVDVRMAMGASFFITMLLCAYGASRHIRRNDPRFLIAITAPWVLFITLLPQLAARYTFYPAVVGACLVAVSTTVSLLQLLLTLLASIMIVNQILYADPDIAPITFTMTRPTHPGLGWVMLLLSGLFLYLAVASPRRWKSKLGPA